MKVIEALAGLLRKILRHEVRFDDGSVIDFAGPESLLYSESDGRSMDISWSWQIHSVRAREIRRQDIFQWMSPHKLEAISEEKREEILKKVRAFSRRHRIGLRELP